MKQNNKNIFLFFNLFIIILLIFCKPASADKPDRVLVLPFNIHSEEDLSFLQKGIENMLSSRLSMEGEVVLISREETGQAIKGMPEPISEETALSLGAKLQADYILLGSLTVFGESISTDARFIEVKTKKPVVMFNQSGKSRDDVISHVNLFAGRINETVFGRKTFSDQQPPAQTKAKEDISSHPDALLPGEKKKDLSASKAASAGDASAQIWKSRELKTKIKGMAIGDVDGDGKQEAVFIGGSKVFIYRYDDGRFVRIGEVAGKRNNIYIGVDVADINNNGKSEIFVTNLSSSTKRLKSFVLEWNGAEFGKIEDKAKWYYRVLNVPKRGGHILLGQKRGIDEIFSRKGVYELIWNNGQYEPGQPENLPKNMNVYGFTYGNVFNDGREMIVAFTYDEHIYILDKNGNEEWKSGERYGGSTTYLEYPYDVDVAEPPSERLKAHYYLPQRIHIADLDKDGKNEVVVVKNNSLTGRLLARVRVYQSGHIEAFDLDEIGSALKWKTREISGYISDYAIGDLNNDGRNELVFSVVAKTGALSGKDRSYIVTWDIP